MQIDTKKQSNPAKLFELFNGIDTFWHICLKSYELFTYIDIFKKFSVKNLSILTQTAN